jgi:hypothetical protein
VQVVVVVPVEDLVVLAVVPEYHPAQAMEVKVDRARQLPPVV